MDKYWVKVKWADFNCTTNCMKVSCIKSGKWKGDITDVPDYELQAYCGTNFGIYDAGDTIHLSTLMDKLGHSGINAANTIGFAAELYQRGIFTEEDIGFKLEWGDAEAFDKLTRMMAYRQGIGDILAEGSYRAAIKIATRAQSLPAQAKAAQKAPGHRIYSSEFNWCVRTTNLLTLCTNVHIMFEGRQDA